MEWDFGPACDSLPGEAGGVSMRSLDFYTKFLTDPQTGVEQHHFAFHGILPPYLGLALK
jgi:hypothetical protein